mgnify:FL=1
MIGVIGRLQVRTYQNDKGESRRVTEVVLEEIEFLQSKPKEDSKISKEKVDSNKPYEEFAKEHQEEFVYTDEEDLPF